MDKETKNEFKKLAELLGGKIDGNAKNIVKLGRKIDGNAKNIAKLSKKIDDELPTAKMINNSFEAVKKDLENFATKEDFKKIEEKMDNKFENIEKSLDKISGDLQIQKNVPIIRKVDEKVNKHIEIHKKRGNITKEDAAIISKINPFPGKEALAQ
jgi:hypothetical protein